MIKLDWGTGLFEVRVSNRVTERDVEDLKRGLGRAIDRGGDARVLCTVTEFWGFDSEAIWEELRHWLRCLPRPARIALLADNGWLDRIADSRLDRAWTRPGRGRAPVEIRGFPQEHEPEARRWLGLHPVACGYDVIVPWSPGRGRATTPGPPSR